MNESLTSSRTPRLLTAVLVLLCLVVLLQLGLLLQRHLHRARPAPVKPPAAPVWSPADEMESLHARINRMFDQTFRFPSAERVDPPTAPGDSAVASSEDPFTHMRRMQRQIDALFAGAMNDLGNQSPGFDEGWTRLEITPGFSIRDTGNSYVITVHLPGVDKSDIHISMTDSVLGLIVNQTTRTATRTAQGTLIRESQQARRFERHLRLPGATGNQEDIQALYDQDVLRITVPRTEQTDPEPKSIPVHEKKP
jgi:HSP20 family protein